jgi:hypothetical protein
MPTFGFSAFLKLLSLNVRPQRREVRQRFTPSEGGYDFHRSLRLRAHRLIVDSEDLQDLIDESGTIKNAAERRSLIAGLKQLDSWREANPGKVVPVPGSTYASPNGHFKVSFLPDFGWRMGGQSIAVHVWNTGIKLSPRMTYAALALAQSAYTERSPPDDVAVLSLPDFKLYRLSDVPDPMRLARVIAVGLEGVFESVRDELDRGEGDQTDERPAR